MDVAEFVDLVMPGIAEECEERGCPEWGDHHCEGGGFRCEEHCQCDVPGDEFEERQ